LPRTDVQVELRDSRAELLTRVAVILRPYRNVERTAVTAGSEGEGSRSSAFLSMLPSPSATSAEGFAFGPTSSLRLLSTSGKAMQVLSSGSKIKRPRTAVAPPIPSLFVYNNMRVTSEYVKTAKSQT
jgi:hypothetical protein